MEKNALNQQKEKTYSVCVGKYSLRDASVEQLNNLYEVINEFLEKEKELIPAIKTNSNDNNEIIIEKEISFSWNREIHTNYCIITDNENLQELTNSQLLDLYYTLKKFLFKSEIKENQQCQSQKIIIDKDNSISNIEIKEDFIKDGEKILKSNPGISKTIKTRQKSIHYYVEYTIYLNDGVIQELTFNNLIELKNKILIYLNYYNQYSS